MNKLLFVLVFGALHFCHSARILGVIPTASYSHQVLFQPLWKELSLRGHQVTVLTTNPINDPTLTNLTEIDLGFSYKVFNDNVPEIISNNHNLVEYIKLTIKMFLNSVEKQLEHPPVKQLINDPSIRFDLLMAENILEVPLAFSKLYDCPYIGLLLSDPSNSMNLYMGNPTHPIVYPDFMLGEEGKLLLIKRIVSVLYEIFLDVFFKWVTIPYQEEIIEKHFGLKYDLVEHKKNASLIFINADPIFHSVRAFSPTTIPIGGKILRLPSKPLTKELQSILDKATEGFIYFSLGSNVDTSDISKETINVILNTFKELPYTVLWKYDLDDFPDKPRNVVISKWIPQLEVLKHVNIKLFITHGGAMSKEEGLSARVPMLGMPIFTDQHYNVKKLVNRGCALSVDHKTLEKNQFKAAILELIENPTYRNQIKKLADLAEDQPMPGLERAIWWTEYVLRHNGTRHLRSPLLDVPVYQYYLLDVAAVFIFVFITLVYLSIVIVRNVKKCLIYITRRSKKTKND